MLELVITLTFASVMLLFMTFPATKIVNFIESKVTIPEKWHIPLLLSMTVFLSLFIALFLRYA